MRDNIEKSHIKNLLLFGREHDFQLNVVCLEKNKRVISIEDQKVVIWPIKEFLEDLWGEKIWL